MSKMSKLICDAAILHAVKARDKRLLNRCELELIKSKKIEPWHPLGYKYSGYNPISIANDKVGELFVYWSLIEESECYECEGDGFLYASGRRNELRVTCPCCEGTGEVDCDSFDDSDWLVTDIEGKIQDSEEVKNLNFDDFESDCPLVAFRRKYIADLENAETGL